MLDTRLDHVGQAIFDVVSVALPFACQKILFGPRRGEKHSQKGSGVRLDIYPAQLYGGLKFVLLLWRSLFVVVYYGAVCLSLWRITQLIGDMPFLYLILGTMITIRPLRTSQVGWVWNGLKVVHFVNK